MRVSADVAVVGLGPAGVAAAVTAGEAGARVVVFDDGSGAGGQIWRHRPHERGRLPKLAHAWLDRFDRLAGPENACRTFAGATVVDAPGPGRLVALTTEGAPPSVLEVDARAIVLATGARERFLPFPGWTLPGIVGVGGAQALVKTGADVRGLRAVVAGTGPLLFPVAATLARSGARVVVVAEQAPASRLVSFAARLLGHPAKIVEAVRYRTAFVRSPFRAGTWVAAATARDRVLRVTLADGRKRWDVDCDLLACAFGLVPNLELARLLGCRLENASVAVDKGQRTSVTGVFAAGEACGVGGADLALIEGEIAGGTAVRRPVAPGAMERRRRLRRFAGALATSFALRPELRHLATSETIVCRCEDVALGRLRPDWAPRQAKLYTRAGMGPCQGRICGSALEFLFGWPADTVRPPLYPTPFEALKENEA